MIDITMKINGKTIRPDQIGNELEKSVMSSIEKQIKGRIGGSLCPKHGEHPRVECIGRALDDLTLRVHGCCDQLINSVESALNDDCKE